MEPFACIYIHAHSLTLIEECPGYGVKVISRWQYQCANIKISDQSKYNIIFKKVVHKRGESEINYIKTVQNTKALAISAGISYTEDLPMNTFLDNI